ncbi:MULTISPECIES: helix-turn-helix transcriptional regulator [unclassified Mycolicibacterium]|uniref:helix-turn-helix transcriptional regulator n=1 Tax=unclassified Mycolicibacterium TaxID=2636767 RepID=UPI002EDB511C
MDGQGITADELSVVTDSRYPRTPPVVSVHAVSVEVALRSELRRLGARLRELRLAAGETQECVAAAVAVTRSYLSEIEAGKTNMTLRTLYALCGHFGVTPATCSSSTNPCSRGHAHDDDVQYGPASRVTM